jgi:membrane protease YdiL (CAAX protease family)
MMWLAVTLLSSGFFYWFGVLRKRYELTWAAGILLGLILLWMSGQGERPGLMLVSAGGTAALAWALTTRYLVIRPVLGWPPLILLLLLFGFKALPGLRESAIIFVRGQILFSPAHLVLLLIIPWVVLPPVHPNRPWPFPVHPLRLFTIILMITLAILMPLALLSGYARWGTPTVATTVVVCKLAYNLVFVCVIEESFFRGILQTALIQWLRRLNRPSTDGWAVLGTSLLFGGAHWGGGLSFIMLATLAGLGYGLMYYFTRRLEYAVFLHFAVNAVHELVLAAVPGASGLQPA